MFLLLVTVVLIYILLSIILLYGTYRHPSPQVNHEPRVSVVVAAKDEEENIEDCLNSLAELDYPKEKLEVIVVDDRSRDRTGELIAEFVRGKDNFRFLTVTEEPTTLSGKANAIQTGIKNSSGDIILLTDADCCVPPSWVKTITSYFEEDVGLVAGLTLLDHKKDGSLFFDKVQSLDWIYLLTVGAGAAGVGRPLSCVGNNLSFRRSAYQQVGGYQGVGFSLTEDFALFKAIAERTPWRVSFTIDPRARVQSKPLKSLRQFYQQRKRWLIGGKTVSPFGKLLMAISFLAHILIPASFILLKNPLIALVSCGSVMLSDFLILLRATITLKKTDLLKYFPLFELFYFFYTTMIAFSILSGKVHWKGRVYRA